MNKYLLACVATLLMFSACEKKESSTAPEKENSTVQEAEKWNPVENELGVDPLNEDAVDDAKALPEETPKDHWHDGTWTDDENNESLNAQEQMIKDSAEKIKEDNSKSEESKERTESADSKNISSEPMVGQEPRDWEKYQQTSYDPGADPLDDEDTEETEGIVYGKLNKANDTPDEWTQEEDSESRRVEENTMPLDSAIEKNKEKAEEKAKMGLAK